MKIGKLIRNPVVVRNGFDYGAPWSEWLRIFYEFAGRADPLYEPPRRDGDPQRVPPAGCKTRPPKPAGYRGKTKVIA
jgi:hypothetical protein